MIENPPHRARRRVADLQKDVVSLRAQAGRLRGMGHLRVESWLMLAYFAHALLAVLSSNVGLATCAISQMNPVSSRAMATQILLWCTPRALSVR